jgi:hypothetical protein
MPTMVQNYEARIKKFVYDMAKDPVQIKAFSPPISTTRKEFIAEQRKIKGTPTPEFSFKHFMTDKEKAEQYNKNFNETMRRSRMSFINTKSPENTTADQNNTTENIKQSHVHSNQKSPTGYMQPSMRFKPRTDLERIYDAINEYSYGRAGEKDIINNQLKMLNLNNFQKMGPKEEDVGNYSYKSNKFKVNERMLKALKDEREKLKDVPNSQDLIRSINKIIKMNYPNQSQDDLSSQRSAASKNQFKRKFVDNSYAKNILKEYHLKTHFKAASVFSMNLNNTYNNGK